MAQKTPTQKSDAEAIESAADRISEINEKIRELREWEDGLSNGCLSVVFDNPDDPDSDSDRKIELGGDDGGVSYALRAHLSAQIEASIKEIKTLMIATIKP